MGRRRFLAALFFFFEKTIEIRGNYGREARQFGLVLRDEIPRLYEKQRATKNSGQWCSFRRSLWMDRLLVFVVDGSNTVSLHPAMIRGLTSHAV
jgi:hypothetical protein